MPYFVQYCVVGNVECHFVFNLLLFFFFLVNVFFTNNIGKLSNFLLAFFFVLFCFFGWYILLMSLVNKVCSIL